MADVNWGAAALVPSSTGLIVTKQAQVAINAGQAVYEDLTNGGKWNLCDGDALESSLCVGVAVADAQANEMCPVAIAGNTITASSGTPLTKGTAYFVSLTAGGIAVAGDLASGDYVTFLGIATSTTALLIQPVASQVAI